MYLLHDYRYTCVVTKLDMCHELRIRNTKPLHVPQLKRDMLDCSAVAHAFVLMITPTALITFCQNSSSILILLDQLHQLRLVLIPCLRSLDE